MRASDRDRERVVQQLRNHYGAGRLSEEELDTRSEAAYTARSVTDLEALTLDLPSSEVALPVAEQPARRPKHELTRGGQALRTSVRIHATIYVLVNLMLIGIWAASGAGYFWPIWPILGWGIGLGGHASPLLAGAGRRTVHPSHRLAAPTSIDEVATTVGTERPSLRGAASPDGTVTILFSDIEGSTRLNEQLGDTRWLDLLRRHHRVIRGRVEAYGGFEVKVQGDGFMVAFPGARRAVQCARAIQQAIAAEFGAGGADGAIRVRIGLHTGEVLKDQDDFYGKNVVLAARIAEQANGGEILASSVVKELVDSGGDIGFDEERAVSLKGLAGEYRIFRVT